MNATSAPPLAIEIVEGLDAFIALRPEWDALFETMRRPQAVFQSHAFLRHWAAQYAPSRDDIRILLGRSGGRLVMAWPLILSHRLGIREIAIMGAPVAQFADVLLAPSAFARDWLGQGLRALAALGPDLLRLRNLRDDAALSMLDLTGSAALDRMSAPFALLRSRVDNGGPSGCYPARERSNVRRRLRRLAERGAVGVETFGPGPRAAELATGAVMMKRAILRDRGILAPTVNDPRFGRFFASLAADPSSPLQVTTLSIDGRPIAIDLSLDCGDTAFGHVIAVDPDHEKGGLGGLLVHLSFAQALLRGRERFDMLAPAAPYKLDHANGSVGVTTVLLPLTLRGRIASLLWPRRLQPIAKSAFARLPRPLRSWIARRSALNTE